MGVLVTFDYEGISIPNLYFRIRNITLNNAVWGGTAQGFVDRETSLTCVPPMRAPFEMYVTTPYVPGVDVYVSAYTAAHNFPAFSNVVDVLEDSPPPGAP